MSDRSTEVAIGGGNPHTLDGYSQAGRIRTKRRVVIDIYDHTSDEEIAEILEVLRGVGLVDPRVEVTP